MGQTHARGEQRKRSESLRRKRKKRLAVSQNDGRTKEEEGGSGWDICNGAWHTAALRSLVVNYSDQGHFP